MSHIFMLLNTCSSYCSSNSSTSNRRPILH